MRLTTHPDFGREVRRPFEVHENCYDCVEFYDGCNAWLASKEFHCADYNRLPDVMPGTCGQVFPPSLMRGRKEPRARKERGTVHQPAAIPADGEPQGRPGPVEGQPTESSRPLAPALNPADPPQGEVAPRTERSPRQPCRPSPIANRGLSGERLCACGALLRKRERCCEDCRQKRRQETMHRRRNQKGAFAGVDADSGVPFPAPQGASTYARSGAHS